MTTETKMSAGAALIEANAAIAFAKIKSHFPDGFFKHPDEETLRLMFLAGFGEGVEMGLNI